MTIYGDVKDFLCNGNGSRITALDASHNTSLVYLSCAKNQLTSLDVSGLTNLSWLLCNNNQLTSLNVSGCNNLERIYCYDNQMSTQTIDNLYCQLSDKISEGTGGRLIVSCIATDEIVLATNKTNATDKNWDVKYYNEEDNMVDFPQTNGTYVCGEESSALANVEEQTISLYPNPAKDYVVLEGIKGEKVKVFDVNGRIVKQEVINERLDIRDLQSGVYYLQVKDITEKLIKK